MATTSVGSRIHYPDSDGKPMAESPVHRDVMGDMIYGLQDWFAADPSVYVSGNMFLDFVEGDPKRNVSPDVMVVRGIDKAVERKSYKTREEADKGRLPSEVVGLHFEADGRQLSLYDPGIGRRLLTRLETIRRQDRMIAEFNEARERERDQIDQIRAELERLRREVEALRAGDSSRKKRK